MNGKTLAELYADQKEHHKDRAVMYAAIDQMVRNDWSLPPELSAVWWLRTVVSTDPSDAVQTAVRTLSTHLPKFRVLPMAPSKENRDRADQIERVLKWHWERAAKFARTRPLQGIVESAVRYAAVAVQVEHMPTQIKIMGKGIPADVRRQMEECQYRVRITNPGQVYATWGDWGTDNILAVRTVRLTEFVATWGERANALKRQQRKNEDLQYVTYFDYTDHLDRMIVAVPHERQTGQPVEPDNENAVEIMNEGHGLPFFPWCYREYGSDMEGSSRYNITPILRSIYDADQWATQNIAESLAASLLIQRAAAPIAKTETPTGEGVEADWTEPTSTINLRTGEQYEPVMPPVIDPNVQNLADRIGQRMSKSTVARVLQNLDLPSNTAFSTINTIMETAMGAVAPYKQLAEDAVADCARLMLHWAHYTRQNLEAYGTDRDQPGQQYILKPEMYDPVTINLSVALTPYTPVDRIAQINGAIMMVDRLNQPIARAVELLGVEDAQTAFVERAEEQMSLAALQDTIRLRSAQIDLKVQQQQMQLQMQAQQVQQQQQMQMQQQAQQMQQQQMAAAQQQQMAMAAGGLPPGAGGQQQVAPGTVARNMMAAFQETQGQGFNPGMGGTPAAEAAPDMTGGVITGEQAPEERGRTGAGGMPR